MKTYTFGELKLGLICCAIDKNCKNCPFLQETACKQQLLSAAFNCINVMENDLETITREAEAWEYLASVHEHDLIELRESLDNRSK